MVDVPYSVFSTKAIDFRNEPLFLGSGRNVSRLDLAIEQVIQGKVDKALGLMWFKNDFSYKQDGEDYSRMSQDLKELYLKNLKFQTLADSIAARSVIETFGPITTNPQLEVWWYQHSFYEGVVHSPTYAEIVKALPVDAKLVFDDIIINKDITDRAHLIVAKFDDTIKWNCMRTLGLSSYNEYEHKKSIVLSLHALNILEAVLFKSSFITTFAFNENGMMESSAKAVKKIQLDEIGHYQMTSYLIKRHKDLPDWAAAFAEVNDEVIRMYEEARQVDYAWIDYVFPEGKVINLLGINNSALKQFVDYNIYNVMGTVGLKHIVKRVHNPCIWADKYAKLSSTQVAMKETDSSNYLLGKLNPEVSDSDYSEFLI